MSTPEREATDPRDLLPSGTHVTPQATDFAEFYRDQMPKLVSFLLYQGATLNDAADLAQYTMTELFKSWEQVSFRRLGFEGSGRGPSSAVPLS